MRIAIDCFKQVRGSGKSFGIYNVALGLVKHLARERDFTDNETIKEAELIVFGNELNRDEFDIDGVTFIKINKLDPRKRMDCVRWEMVGVARQCRKHKIDVIVYPRGFCSIKRACRQIAIVHDMIPFYYHEHYPDFFNKTENFYIMKRLLQSIKRADLVVTISEYSKESILKYSGVNEDKIKVIYNAATEIACNSEKLDKEDKYISAITSTFPHKNAKGIIETYKIYRQVAKNPLKLVIVGISELDDSIENDLTPYITCIKYFKNNKDLYDAIGQSEAFMFLSLTEGFGLPPLEAMTLGTPVLCSSGGSLKEIAGNAAIFVNPDDYENAAIELDRMINDKDMREELVRRGRERVRKFTWRANAQSFWKVILNE